MKILLAVLAVLGGMLALRLMELQLRRGLDFARAAAAPDRTPYKSIPPTRGHILARGPGGKGTVELVANEPCFELAVYYPVLDPDEWWIADQHRRIRNAKRAETDNPKLDVPREELAYTLQQELDRFWALLSELTSNDPEDLLEIRDRIVRTIQPRIKAVRNRTEYGEYQIAEQQMYFALIGGLDENMALELRGRLAGSRWAIVRPGVRRVYHKARPFCHLLGRTQFVAGTPEKVYARDDYIRKNEDRLPGEMYGFEGLEKTYDDRLQGVRGWLKFEKETEVDTPAVDGEDLTLTIDAELQNFAVNQLDKRIHNPSEPLHPLRYATGGGVVVLDIVRHELLALASYPTFDPGVYSDPKKFRELRLDRKGQPFVNRCLSRYVPGSIVKPFIGAWALEKSKITSVSTFECIGRYSPDLPKFYCWKPGGHGPIALVDAIAGSCDVYFYHVGRILNIQGLHDFFLNCRLNEPVPIKVANDEGQFPTPEWFQRHHQRTISLGDAMNLGIGQGDMEITPLQAALLTEGLINGSIQPPKLLVDDALPPARPMGITPNPRRLARQGMAQAVRDPYGTARSAYDKKITIAAKTGSAQTPPKPVLWKVAYTDPDTGRRFEEKTSDWEGFFRRHLVSPHKLKLTAVEHSDPPRWEIAYPHPETGKEIRHGVDQPDLKAFYKKYFLDRREKRTVETFPVLVPEDKLDKTSDREKGLAHAWIIGFAPADRPRIVVVVFIEYGIAGGSAAGPVLRDVMLKCKELGYLN